MAKHLTTAAANNAPQIGHSKLHQRKPDIAPLPPMVRMTDEELGKVAYDAYCEARHWKSFEGQPLPKWEDTRTDVKVGWMKSARAVAKACTAALPVVRWMPPPPGTKLGR